MRRLSTLRIGDIKVPVFATQHPWIVPHTEGRFGPLVETQTSLSILRWLAMKDSMGQHCMLVTTDEGGFASILVRRYLEMVRAIFSQFVSVFFFVFLNEPAL